jgi:hypothetical protein
MMWTLGIMVVKTFPAVTFMVVVDNIVVDSSP